MIAAFTHLFHGTNHLREEDSQQAVALEVVSLTNRIGNERTLIWGSDWHLDHLTEEKKQHFFSQIAAMDGDVLILTGDLELAAADSKRGAQGLSATLIKMQAAIKKPILFICGNHDYYRGSVEEVRKSLMGFSLARDQIQYVREGIVLRISSEVALVGQEGWADGRSGDFFKSDMALNDFFEIKELAVANVKEIPTQKTLLKMQHLADQASDYAKNILPELFKQYRHVYFITHVPPFREAALYQGKPSSDSAVPFFVNQKLGETLLRMMKKHADKQLTVLCGHTHHERDYWPIPHIFRVIVAKSEYGHPRVENALKFDIKSS